MNSDQILSLLRTVLKFVGGIAVSAGWIYASSVDGLVGAVLTILAAVWSVWVHREVTIPSEAVKAVELEPNAGVKIDPANPPEMK